MLLILITVQHKALKRVTSQAMMINAGRDEVYERVRRNEMLISLYEAIKCLLVTLFYVQLLIFLLHLHHNPLSDSVGLFDLDWSTGFSVE